MDIGNLLWLALLLLAVQPVLRQRLLELSRARLIARIERQRGSRVILLVHRQETMRLFGLPFFRYVDMNDAEQLIRAIHLTHTDVPIDLLVHTPGGLALSAMQIARAIHRHRGKVTVIVPHYAMSAGTLIALAADEILMSEDAVLGPVDPQVAGQPAASIVRVLGRKPPEKISDRTLVLADQAEKAIEQLRQTISELLSDRLPPERREEVAAILSEGRWTHDYPITFQQAKQLDLPVSADVPEEFWRLMELFPQPMRRQASVEYLPGTREPQQSPDAGRRPPPG
jgi:ClpP class serine protease